MSPKTWAALFVAVLASTACRTTPEKPDSPGRAASASYAVQPLLDPCWPSDAAPTQRVALTLVREGNALRDVMFEPKNGASNSVGRCLRQVLWLYPWRGDLPERVELSPPRGPPSGWAVLEHVRLLASDAYPSERGVVDPVPLVQGCFAYGVGVRSGVAFYVRTQPVRVFALAQGTEDGSHPTEVVTDTERCVQAVLASTVYPGSRNYTFDFSRGASGGDPAPREALAHYFEPAGLQDATGVIDQSRARAALAELGPSISTCWNGALARRGGVSGGRTLRIRVEPSGGVAFVQVVGNHSDGAGDAVDYLLDKCVADAVRSAKLPPPEGGAGEFAYSWVFALRR